MTFAEIAALYGNYMWLIGIAVVTYLSMGILKKAFLKATAENATTAKGRRVANTILGIAISVGFASLLGALCNMLFAAGVHVMWFVAAGALANYSYLLKERFCDAEKMAMATAVAEAVHESNKNISETDFPKITERVKEMTEKFKTSESNIHAQEVVTVATGIANSVGVESCGDEEIENALKTLKANNVDVSEIEAKIKDALSDGKITAAEKSIIMQAVEILRQRYGR